MISWLWLFPAFGCGVIVANQIQIVKNSKQIRRNSEAMRQALQKRSH